MIISEHPYDIMATSSSQNFKLNVPKKFYGKWITEVIFIGKKNENNLGYSGLIFVFELSHHR